MLKKFKYYVQKILCVDFFHSIFLFLNGWEKGDSTGITPLESYLALRKLFILTNGRFNDFVSFLLSFRHPQYKDIKPQGILGDLTQSEVKSISSQLRKDGYYISTQKLDSQIIDRLIDFAKRTPIPSSGIISSNGQTPSPKDIFFDPENIISPRYVFDVQKLFDNQDIQNLLADQSLLAVAQEYLNCSPVLEYFGMWWSAPFNKQKTSEAAQEYHFDMDTIKFLKIFFYLTDVDPDTGPHCYVRGSHIRKPKSLLLDGRRSDAEIQSHYQLSDCKEVCGKAGTILIGDTRSFHKGKPLLKNCRLLLEIEFSNSLFGQSIEKVQHTKSDSQILNEYLQKYPRTYRGIFAE